MAQNQVPDPRRKTGPFLALGIGLFFVVVVIGFALNGSPDRTEQVPVAADPNPTSVNAQQPGSRPFEVDAGVKPLLDAGTIDPDALQQAMAEASDAGQAIAAQQADAGAATGPDAG